jgi:hypothetical protein
MSGPACAAWPFGLTSGPLSALADGMKSSMFCAVSTDNRKVKQLRNIPVKDRWGTDCIPHVPGQFTNISRNLPFL